MASADPISKNTQSLKRKAVTNPASQSHKRRRVKLLDARYIATQTSGKAYGDGEVNVDKFVRAREFEIKALEDGMKRARKSLTSRAFQSVPRELRRRTASHNVKKVPKRLRAKAAREMAEDNTPTVTAKKRKKSTHMRLRLDTANRLKKLGTASKKVETKTSSTGKQDVNEKDAVMTDVTSQSIVEPRLPRIKKGVLHGRPKVKSKFRKRQIHKAWLPTHLFHAKRAHMTPPKEPLWRMAIPLSPTAKCYRSTHRASVLRGAVAWDMSYISTIGLEGPIKSIQGIFKAMGVGAKSSDKFWDAADSKWISGTRTWSGWLYKRNGWPTKAIAPATIIWQVKTNDESGENQSKAAVRRMKQEFRKVLIRVHPSAFLQLWEELLRLSKVQKPTVSIEDLRFEVGSIEITGPAATETLVGSLWPSSTQPGKDSVEEVWQGLSTVTNPSVLPKNALLALNVSDPRLHHPPQKHERSGSCSEAKHQTLLQTLCAWPVDRSQSSSGLFDRGARWSACRKLASQKAIHRRKALAAPGAYPDPSPNDPQIPIIAMASHRGTQRQGSWTILLPWKCVLPVWYAMMYFPLSSGGTARFAGLNERRQVEFEAASPWFPGDFPGTEAGMAWELAERAKRKETWEKRPKGKRIEWDSLDLGGARKGEIGLGWASDWQRLVNDATKPEAISPRLFQLTSAEATARLGDDKGLLEALPAEEGEALITVSIKLICRGAPSTCARIYRLPTTSMEHRKRWLDEASTSSSGKRQKNSMNAIRVVKSAPLHTRRQQLAASLLQGSCAVGERDAPPVPDEVDLIGFVTTGNFNLGEGQATAIGSLLLSRILADGHSKRLEGDKRLCIVRDAGQRLGRLAKWEEI